MHISPVHLSDLPKSFSGNFVVEAPAFRVGGADAEAERSVAESRRDFADAAACCVKGKDTPLFAMRQAQFNVGLAAPNQRTAANGEEGCHGSVGEFRPLALNVGEVGQEDVGGLFQRLSIEGTGPEGGGRRAPNTQ